MKDKKKDFLSKAVLILFCLFSTMVIQAQITISLSNVSLNKVLETVKEQSDYQFFYNDDLAQVIIPKVEGKDLSIKEILNQISSNSEVEFSIVKKVVYLKKKTSIQPQKQVISGSICDENEEPLIGVNVMIVGSTGLGTISDFDGNFSMEVSGNNVEIKCSYIGYKTVTQKLNGKSTLKIVMSEDLQLMDEVVVTALGIKREKKMLGYAMQEVHADELNTTGDNQVTSALQGKVAGVQINTSSTGLGGSSKITIRGNSSLTDNNQPLWIVDGVPFSDNSSSNNSAFGGVDRGNTSIDINPDDIETISVLKGPNAAALYGSRAGNGVILVTTKKGSQRPGLGVDYSGTFTWTSIADELDRQTTYGQGVDGIYNAKSQYSFGAKLDDQPVKAWNGQMVPYSNYGNKMKEYFNTGFQQNHNISVGGVKDGSHYRCSFGASNADGMFEGESLDKYMVDLNTGMEMNKYISMDAKLSISDTKAQNRPYFGVYGELSQLMYVPNNVRLSDLQHYRDEDHMHLNWTGPTTDYLNPYYVNKQRRNSDERFRAFGYYNMKAHFTDWLYLSGKYSFDYYRTRLFNADLSNGTKTPNIGDVEEDLMDRTEDNFFEQNFEILLIGNNTIGEKFKVGYTLGSNIMLNENNALGVSLSNMIYKNDWMVNHAQNLNSAGENGYRRKTVSAFASLQMAYDEFVSLDLTARNDWSSTLPKTNNSYFYPSANLGFIWTDFARVHGATLPSWLTFAKTRFSAAMVGKDADPLSTYNRISGGYISGHYNPSISHLKRNEDLKNEITISYEAGLDMKFFQNRLGFDCTYYYGYTENQIMIIPDKAPWVDGRIINSGLIVNSGIEAMLYATIVKTKDFEFNMNLNLAHNNSTVEKLNDNVKHVYLNGDGNFPVQVGAVEGGRLGDIYARVLYKRDDQGNIIYNNGVPDRVSSEQYSLDHPIGNIQPDLLVSLSPQISYKGLSISALFDMKFGGNIVSVSEAMATAHGISKRTEERGDIILPGVNRQNTVNTTPINAQTYYQLIGGRKEAIAEEFIYDASYIRLKEVSLGYSLPKKFLKKTPFTKARFSVVGRNLCYLLKHTPGTSPEGGYDTSMFSQAIDFSSMPYSRTYGFTVNLGF